MPEGKKSQIIKPGKGIKFTTPVFRVAYHNLFVAKAYEDGDGVKKFGVVAVFDKTKFGDKDKDKYRVMLSELKRVSQEALKKDWTKLPSDKRALRQGAERENALAYPPGCTFAYMTNQSRPGVTVLTADGNIKCGPEEENAHLIYPGIWGRATANVWAWKNGKGVSIGLQNFQKIKNGERLDNRNEAVDDFDEELDDDWKVDDDEGDDFGDNDGGTDDEDEFG